MSNKTPLFEFLADAPLHVWAAYVAITLVVVALVGSVVYAGWLAVLPL